MTSVVPGDTPADRLGSRVRALRATRRWTQAELGTLAGMDRTYTGSIERGERNVSLSNLVRLADAFSLTLSEFLAGV